MNTSWVWGRSMRPNAQLSKAKPPASDTADRWRSWALAQWMVVSMARIEIVIGAPGADNSPALSGLWRPSGGVKRAVLASTPWSGYPSMRYQCCCFLGAVGLTLLSIVVPVFNEELNIEPFYQATTA